MFETGIRQVRAAFSTVLGRPFNPVVIERLVRDAIDTWVEFGEPGDDVGALLDGPYADPNLRADLQTRALRRTARRLAARSPFYRERFEKSDVDVRGLTLETVNAIPVTTRADLVERADDFVCGTPFLSTRTTGSTGRPAEVWLSGRELRLWPALIALSMVLRGELRTDDRMQVSVSSRAAGTVHLTAGICRLVDVPCRIVGQVPPGEGLDHLCGAFGAPPTILQTYPSYLGALVTLARDRGLGPEDFALHTINVGGELMSRALTQAAQETFGARQVVDVYGATELLPAGGRTCREDHLHIDPNMAYAEVIALAGDAPAGPGELGTLVVTPYHPYRECMPVFRYDTQDLVRTLTDEPLTCDLAAMPAVSQVLGKAAGLLPTAVGTVTPRQLVEALDALPGARWPVRFAATTAGDAVRLTLPEAYTGGLTPGEVAIHLAQHGIDAVVAVTRQYPAALRRLRCDLVEQTFTGSAA